MRVRPVGRQPASHLVILTMQVTEVVIAKNGVISPRPRLATLAANLNRVPFLDEVDEVRETGNGLSHWRPRSLREALSLAERSLLEDHRSARKCERRRKSYRSQDSLKTDQPEIG